MLATRLKNARDFTKTDSIRDRHCRRQRCIMWSAVTSATAVSSVAAARGWFRAVGAVQKRRPPRKRAKAVRPRSPPPVPTAAPAHGVLGSRAAGRRDCQHAGCALLGGFGKRVSARLPPKPGPWLILSTGGEDGAFGAGLLSGWSKAGTRPEFSLVTGVSTGALIAPYAFLGPRYDEQLRDAYTTISATDIFEIGGKGESFLDTWPLHEPDREARHARTCSRRSPPNMRADGVC